MPTRHRRPRRAAPIAETGYSSCCQQPGTIEILGDDVAADVIEWVDDEALSPG